MQGTKTTLLGSSAATKTLNYLGLALDDYRAARLLIRQGLLTQGVALAATAVEKELKALLAIHDVYTKKHLDPGLVTLACKHSPELSGALEIDFIRFLGKAYDVRYAAADREGFNIVINQHRTLILLDITMLTIDSGFRPTLDAQPSETPLQAAIKGKDTLVTEDNLPLGFVTQSEINTRNNKMFELRVGKKLQVLTAKYETEGLNVIGQFCKNTDIDFGKDSWQLALG